MRTVITLLSGLMLANIATLTHAQETQAQGTNTSTKQREAEVALSDGTVQLRYFTSGKQVNVDEGRLQFGAFLSEERDVVLTGAVLVPLDFDFGLGDRFSFALGPQIYAALLEEENNDVLAAALGLDVRFLLFREHEVALTGQAFYSPDILTFGAADNIVDLSARIEMNLTPTLIGFFGARWFTLDLLEGEDRDLQDELLAGVRWRFR